MKCGSLLDNIHESTDMAVKPVHISLERERERERDENVEKLLTSTTKVTFFSPRRGG